MQSRAYRSWQGGYWGASPRSCRGGSCTRCCRPLIVSSSSCWNSWMTSSSRPASFSPRQKANVSSVREAKGWAGGRVLLLGVTFSEEGQGQPGRLPREVGALGTHHLARKSNRWVTDVHFRVPRATAVRAQPKPGSDWTGGLPHRPPALTRNPQGYTSNSCCPVTGVFTGLYGDGGR